MRLAFPSHLWCLVVSAIPLERGLAQIADEETAEAKWILQSEDGGIRGASFSPDGKWLATASSGDNKSVVVWDVATGKEKFTLPGHNRSSFVAFLPGGKDLVANCGPDLAVQVWDLKTKKVRLAFKKPLGVGSPYAVSPDGKWLAAMERTGAIHLYNLATGEGGKKIKGHPKPECLSFSPDGKRLVSGHIDGGLFVWDVESGECLARPVDHGGYYVTAACFSPDGKTFYTADSGRQVFHWDSTTLKPVHKGDVRQTLRYGIDRAALSPDGRTMALQTKTNVALYDVRARKVRADFAGEGQPGRKECIAFSPDGKLLATGSAREPQANCAYVWKIPPPLETKK